MCFKGKTFKSCFLCPPLFSPYPPFSISPSFLFPLSSFLSLSLSLSLSFVLSLSPYLSLSLSCAFFLVRVLADVKSGFANCNFLRCKEIFCNSLR